MVITEKLRFPPLGFAAAKNLSLVLSLVLIEIGISCPSSISSDRKTHQTSDQFDAAKTKNCKYGAAEMRKVDFRVLR